jgi:para-aminobenzoate synthetase/4-amino-4-deoxychorismate lyase
MLPTDSGAGIRARFDDLTVGGTCFELSDPTAVLAARGPDDVRAVLREAQALSRAGHWVAGFVSYEAAAGLDPDLPVCAWPDDHPMTRLPLAWFAAFGTHAAVAPPGPVSAIPAPPWRLDRDQDWHERAVASIRDGIGRGDYYQVNLTARLDATVADPALLYAKLSIAQQGAHNALIVTDEFTVVSCSPELFFATDGNRIIARPMKGTSRRGRWPAEDSDRAAQLRGSGKDRAENAMIVDLVRNDLSRIAEVGSVAAPSLFDVERFPTVWQLTSRIEATARAGTGLPEVFAALFPSGSVTGAPKRSAMRAIAELEARPRGVYCGAIGYLAPGVQLRGRFSVAIRTVTRVNATGYAEYGTGGGITWSSDPVHEWAELLAKTDVLTAAAPLDGLIETLRFEPERGLVNLERHLLRLSESAGYLGFRDVGHAVRDRLTAAVASRDSPARVRVLLSRAGEVEVDVTPLPSAGGPVRLALANEPVASADVSLFHKGSDRSRYARLRAERPEVDDVVLWNERGEVTETTIANLAVLLEGRWFTPALTCGLLPGVERGRLVEAGTLAERVITVEQLGGAEQVALVSSLRGWRPASLAPEVPVG